MLQTRHVDGKIIPWEVCELQKVVIFSWLRRGSLTSMGSDASFGSGPEASWEMYLLRSKDAWVLRSISPVVQIHPLSPTNTSGDEFTHFLKFTNPVTT